MKKGLVWFFALVFLSMIYFSLPCWAAYVTDSCETTALRSGPGNQYKILEMLTSGESVDILNRAKEWTLVQTSKGKRGWVLSRFLMNREPWELQVKKLEQENQMLREKQANFDKEWERLSLREKELADNLTTVAQTKEKLQDDYEELKRGSADYLNLKEQYDAVKTALSAALEKSENLERENKELRSSQDIKWFATGAVVLLGGWLSGLLMGRSRKKQRQSLYS